MNETSQLFDTAAAQAGSQTLANGYSVEALPRQLRANDALAGLLPRGTAVYVPCLAGSEFSETVAACRTAQDAGLIAVPHIPARALRSRDELDHNLAALGEVGIEAALLIAGDNPEPAGPFDSSLDIVCSGYLEKYGIRRLGFAAHPEGHPFASADVLHRAMAEKLRFAKATGSEVWFVTQMAFEAGPVFDWLDHIRASGLDARVRVGVPGPAKLRTLLSFAMKLGVAKSARAFSQKPETARLLFGRWTPETLLRDLDYYRQQKKPHCAIDGIHVFAFGGLGDAANWMAGAAQSSPQSA